MAIRAWTGQMETWVCAAPAARAGGVGARVRVGSRARKGTTVQTALQGTAASLVIGDAQPTRDIRGRKAALDPRALLALPVTPARPGGVAPQGFQGFRALLAPGATRAQTGNPGKACVRAET